MLLCMYLNEGMSLTEKSDTDTGAEVRLILNLIYVYTTGLKKENLKGEKLILTQRPGSDQF